MPIADKLELHRRQSLPELVQDEVLRMIKAGELPAGARLNELDLAERLRISRPPLREALRALEEAGLVRLERNRGMFVRDVSAHEALEMYQVRAGLDDQAGRLLAPIITDKQLQELDRLLTKLESCKSDDIDRTFPLNIAFHDRLVELTGNAVLLQIYRQVINRMHLLRRRSFAGGNAASHAEHRAILAALATRNPELAAQAMRRHVELGFERMRHAYPNEPEETPRRRPLRKAPAERKIDQT
jgi:DNA-binding GntR family transcriptional regulator